MGREAKRERTERRGEKRSEAKRKAPPLLLLSLLLFLFPPPVAVNAAFRAHSSRFLYQQLCFSLREKRESGGEKVETPGGKASPAGNPAEAAATPFSSSRRVFFFVAAFPLPTPFSLPLSLSRARARHERTSPHAKKRSAQPFAPAPRPALENCSDSVSRSQKDRGEKKARDSEQLLSVAEENKKNTSSFVVDGSPSFLSPSLSSPPSTHRWRSR